MSRFNIDGEFTFVELLEDTMNDPDHSHILKKIPKRIKESILKDDFLNESYSHLLIVKLNISNNSKKKVQGLNIELKCDGFYELINQEDKTIFSEFDHIINLDDLRPGNSIFLIIWPNLYIEADEVKIIFDGGVNKPKVEFKTSLSRFSLFFDKWGGKIFIVLLIFSLLLLVFMKMKNLKM